MLNKNIGWVCYHYYPKIVGGAEITDYHIIEKGKELGYKIDRLRFYQPNYDFYVVSNIHNRELNDDIYDENYAFYCHDSLPIDSFEQKLINSSKVNIFLSPLHYDWAQSHFNNIDEYFLQPSPIKEGFNNTKEKNDIIVAIGLIVEHKGIFNVINYAKNNRNKEIKLYGKSLYDINKLKNMSPDNIEYCGLVPHKKVIKILEKADSLIHLPNWIEAFGRVCAEGYLSGCNLLINDRVGFLSYDWDFEDMDNIRNKLKNSDKQFWDNLSKYL